MTTKMVTVQQVWAVIRVDASSSVAASPGDLANQVTVKEVVLDEGLATEEVGRLNRLNADKGAYYFTQQTRLKDRETNVIPQVDSG